MEYACIIAFEDDTIVVEHAKCIVKGSLEELAAQGIRLPVLIPCTPQQRYPNEGSASVLKQTNVHHYSE